MAISYRTRMRSTWNSLQGHLMNYKIDNTNSALTPSLNKLSKDPLFPLGFVCATPAALDVLDRNGVNASPYFARHQHGDFGTLCPENIEQNRLSIKHGMRILSAYKIGEDRIYIITEADRSVTTLLLTSEY
jgi:hypothetical protein